MRLRKAQEQERQNMHTYILSVKAKKISKGMNKRDLIVEPAEAAALEETEGE